jgi:hypothetical protein
VYSHPVHSLIYRSGSGTLGAVEGLRGGGYTGKITVISKEGQQPIDRTKLSKALLADVSKAAWRTKDFYKDASIEFVEGEVEGVDFASKKVSTKSGKDFEYSKLVLATGGTPRWLPLEGLKGDLGNVFLLRTISDTQNIVKAVGDNGKKVVVVGSSFIGMYVTYLYEVYLRHVLTPYVYLKGGWKLPRRHEERRHHCGHGRRFSPVDLFRWTRANCTTEPMERVMGKKVREFNVRNTCETNTDFVHSPLGRQDLPRPP